MAVLSIGQMWATDYELMLTLDVTQGAPSGSTSTGLTDETLLSYLQGAAPATTDIISASLTGNVYKGKGSGGVGVPQECLKIGKASGAGSITFAIANTYDNVTKVEITGYGWKTSTAVSVNSSDAQSPATALSEVTFSYEISGSKSITINSASSAFCATEIKLYKTKSGGTPTPSVTVSPTSYDFGTVHASDAASKVFSVSGSNLTAGTLSISVPEGFSVSPSSISVTEATLAATNVTVSKNTNTIDDYSGNLSISGCGLSETKTVALEMSVVADPVPTGTFELFSGDIEEGDYVIYYNGKAMNTTITNSRFQYIEVTPSEGEIDNPDESIIWHIAPISETSYWTIYSAAESKYAGGTNSKNQGAMLAEITDLAKWTITGSSTYDFENYGRSQASSDSGNKWLRNNGTSGFATYANTMGGALTLYKKQVAGQPKAPTFSIPGGNYESAQSVELSCETEGATIYYTTNGDAPTSSSTQYNGTAIAVDHTMTIKAIAIKNEISSTVASATYTIIVWQTVADVWDDITADGPTNAHIYGYVSQINVGGFDNNFYISDNGSTEGNQLYAYRMNMNSFSVAVGDKVKLAGDLTEYQGKKEFKYANSGATQGLVVALEAKGALQSVAVSGTPTKTEYASGEDFEPAGLKVFGTYANGFVGEITEGITWGNDLTDGKVTENTTVHVTATVNEVASPAYDVAVTVAAKTLESIAVGTASYTIYTGEVLPKPVVTATFSEGDPEDVSAYAVYDTEDVFNTATIDNPDPQTITVSYTFGGATETVTYTVSVKDYANANDAPYTVTEALHIITDAIGSTESAREIVVAGTVSEDNISNNKNRYKISDGENELLVYAGKGFNNETFTNTNYPKVGDVVKVKGKVINYNNNTPEFASGKSYLLSQVRPATIAIENVASFEVGATDLTESDLDITTPSDGDITFVSGDDAVATIEANAIHAVAPGTVTITANLAATANENALNYAAASTMFNVTVIAAQVKYAITFNGNGADGGDAPEAIENKAAGAEVTLPANSYTKTGHTFDGWKVINNTTSEEVEVVAGAFTMPASAVTIQAQWEEISAWAYTYTSNLELKGNSGTKSYAEKVKITVNEVLTEFDALRACTGSAAGSCTIKVPAGTQTLHFHAAAWNAKTSTITVTMGETELLEQVLASDGGIKNSSPYTLEGIPYEYYYSIDLSSYSLAEETTITFSAGSDKRFVLFGVNQEGGIVPELQSIEIAGDLTTKSYKAGDALDLDGLTVNAIYSLGGTPQTPIDITDDAELEWSYAPLVENQTSITITATYKGQTDDITINDLVVSSADPKIYVSTLNVNFASVEVGESVPASETVTVTLTNVASVTATLGGTNPEAFSISPASLTESGDITISILANTDAAASYAATLTISDGEGGADDKTVNLSFAVTEPVVEDDVTGTWTLVTDAATLAAGKKVIIAQYVEADGAINTMAGQASNNRSVIASIVAGATLTPTVGTKVMTLADAGEGHFYLKTSDGEYLYNASTSSKSYLRTKAEEENVSWTIAVDAEGVATITSVENTNRTKMRYNPNTSGSPLFNCYASGQEDIALYMLEEDTPEPPVVDYTEVRNGLTEGWYYTMCLDKAVTAVKAGSIWKVLSKAANGNDVILEEAELPLAAGRPYIFRAAANTLEVAYTGDAVDDPVNDDDNNGLIGSFTQKSIAQSNDNYIIYNNALYFVNSDNVKVGAYRAYLDMTGVPAYSNEPQQGNAPRRRVTMAVYGEQVATGIESIQPSEISNQKVLINGQLFILRGEKMYDATGRLVK